jgi:uncharacterized membrane protein HdeD (DUF308 family)
MPPSFSRKKTITYNQVIARKGFKFMMNSNNNKNSYRMAKKIIGILLIILGTIGLFLPFLQGIALIIVGAMLLGNKWLLKKLKKLKKYFQRKTTKSRKK